MPYTPDATDVANPVAGTVKAATAAAEFIAIKLYMRDVLLAGLNLKAPLASPVLSGNVGIGTGGNPYYHHLSVYSGGAVANYAQFANGNTGLAAANGFLVGVDATGNAVINQQASFNLLVNVAGVERLRVDSNGIGIGGAANASAVLDVQSTTKGLRLPNMTTAQKDAIASPGAGLMVFDTTLGRPCFYSGAAWVTL